MGFKENLKAEMEFMDIKPKELSLKTGLSVNTLRNYINAHDALPNIYSAVKIAKALETTVEELVEGKGSSNSAGNNSEALKFSMLFSKLSSNDKKSVLALMEEMRKHV